MPLRFTFSPVVEGKLHVESGKAKLLRTREELRRGWPAMSDELTRQGHPEIAAQVRRHVEQLPRPFRSGAVENLSADSLDELFGCVSEATIGRCDVWRQAQDNRHC